MIIFENVTKIFGDKETVLDKINFSIDKGSFVYLVGPTGAGKTTVFRLIIRDLLPTEGAINIGEWNLVSLPKSKIPQLRRKVGVVFQDLKLLTDRTIIENVMLPLQFAGIKEKEAERRAGEIILEVGLEGQENKFPVQLSGGERQRVAIARALVFDPDIILADEPTGNLDIKTSFQILDLLKSINNRGTTVFMASHNDKLISTTHRIIMLDRGRIVEDRKGVAKQIKTSSEDGLNKEEAGSSRDEEKVRERKSRSTGSSRKDSGTGDKIKLETLAEK